MATTDDGYDYTLQMHRCPTVYHFDRLHFYRWLAEHGRFDVPEREIYRPMGQSSGALVPPAPLVAVR